MSYATFEKIALAAIVLVAVALGNNFGAAREDESSSRSRDIQLARVSGRVSSASSGVQSFVVAEPRPTVALVPPGPVLPDVPASGTLFSANPLHAAAMVSPGDAPSSRVFRPRGATVSEIAVDARAAIVSDAQSGETYFSLNVGERWPAASITKLMTAFQALTILPPDDVVILTDEDFPPDDTSIVRPVKNGESYTVRDLVSAMLVVSSNGAAEALSRRVGRELFMGGMNARAASWGLQNTYFADPSGLSAANQSTAEDLRRIAGKLVQSDLPILELTRKPKIAIVEQNTKTRRTLQNINAFAGDAGFTGGKTGYTDESGGNLLSIFSVDRRPVVIIVLGTNDRFGETERLLDWFTRNYTLNK